MSNKHSKRICHHPRLVEYLPRHFQGLEMPLQNDHSVHVIQHIIRKILDATTGRIFVAGGGSNLYIAFEEPSDLVWVTLAMPALIPEKIT